MPFAAHMAVLGLRRPRWALPALFVVLVAVGSIMLLAMLAGAALGSGAWNEIPPVAWAGLALWLGLIGVLTVAVVRR